MSILHIARADHWNDARAAGEYRWSSRDLTLERAGFIHCSTAQQVGSVAIAFYADETQPLVVLVIDERAVEASGVEVRYEDAGNGVAFPHIYGALVPAWVTDVRSAAFVDGRFVF